MFKRSLLATLTVGVGLLIAAGSASAGTYQHNQTDLEFLAAAHISDGTSNTISFGEVVAAPTAGSRS